ncbi:UDP-N-acetylglucosamine 2-epimerase (non-hydrolyzing) [Putridiphycobacter roseus]|uniref:UDP-N-acetylglucosamine 2-epimerase (Non-hydrolyzing) n=1 Tax=Putridiphycobacter roseus TaxID=2219161 RepID=A0A2W1MXA1_9FLAO|nr:UDP-N-acetylglucosamine 2-epimerase (non-hydrolyzing) [Putridiphycobacter roseus]PZE16467.1 UDP-N-acetylglucosamine 2-epimerase (non-hydrolyzing) [Putridiphycobacter roseus]
MKILTIIGARPQFIKAAALSREIAKHDDVEEIIVHTGQHFDANMSEIFFSEMEIPKPNYNLGIHSLGHGAMTGRMLEGIEEVLLKEKPDVLLVYGDTNSTIAGALAAKKIHIKVAHVEAGLRSYNMDMPEEVNRILTDRISDFLFCPTQTAVDNLRKEGYQNINCQVIKSGDVMQDAAAFYAGISAEKSTVLKSIGLDQYALVTLHRAENTDDIGRLTAIVSALNAIHEKICPIVLPLHPRTKSKLETAHLNLKVKIIDPVGYFDMIELIKHAALVMTDSGGLQKEAFFFKKNCVTMRDQTEWVELIENGVNVLVGADTEKIKASFQQMLNKASDFSMDLYGNGQASNNIIMALKKALNS